MLIYACVCVLWRVVQAIVFGLENDIAEIAFPSLLYLIVSTIGNFRWTAWEFAGKYG